MKGAVVFHRGALGDSILVWPLLRALANKYSMVVLVTDLAKAQLAQRVAVPHLVAMSAENALFNRLYVEGANVEAVEAATNIDLVLNLAPLQLQSGELVSTWERNAKKQYPRARIAVERGQLDRVLALELAEKWGTVRPTPPALVPVSPTACFFVGAGSAEKRWPLPFWVQLKNACSHLTISMIAGEAEEDRFSPAERKMFAGAGGVFLKTLVELEATLRASAMFVGVDSGPTHLAAQMGLDTVALFGPTDPERWAPIGPRVRVISPEYRRGMAWLKVERVASELPLSLR